MNQLENKKILITGGAGFLGSDLCEKLVESFNCSITILDNLPNGSIKNIEHILHKDNITFIEGCILNRDLLKTVIEDIDIVFHLATLGVRHSLGNPIENHQVNAEGTLYLLEATAFFHLQQYMPIELKYSNKQEKVQIYLCA